MIGFTCRFARWSCTGLWFALARCCDYAQLWRGQPERWRLQGLKKEAEGIEYRVLMMHTGVDSVVPRIQGLPTMAQFQPLRRCVDYLALGHVHKPYEFDGWMYNPGSTETWGAEESAWEDRGYYFVEIDTSEPEALLILKSWLVIIMQHILSANVARSCVTRYALMD